MQILITLCLTVFAVNTFSQSAEVAFRVSEKDLIPEGIAYSPTEKKFYLGSIHKRKIIQVNHDGTVKEFVKSGQDNLEQVLGMTVDGNGRLWACNNSPNHDTTRQISNVHVYDTKSGKLLKRFTLHDGSKHLLNDIYIAASGDAYITDSESGSMHLIPAASDSIQSFLPAGTFYYPNGVTGSTDGRIIVSTARGIMTVNLQTKEIIPLTNDRFLIIGMDGLYRYKNSLIGVQNVFYPEAVVRMHLNDDANSIDDIKSLVSDHNLFDKPTTGVIVGNDFYFIANSQLLQVVRTKGKVKSPEKLSEVFIMKIALKP